MPRHNAPSCLRISVAHREIVLIRKPRKRNIVIRMLTNGEIRVTAAMSVTLDQLHTVMQLRHDWIESVQRRHEELRRRHPQKRYVSGELFIFRGEMLPLQFAVSYEAKTSFVSVIQNALVIGIPHRQWSAFDSAAEHSELAPIVVAFYRHEARILISQRLAHYARQMNVQPHKVTFRSQRTRWGSCTVRQHLSLNWLLIIAPLEVIDYLCVHELAHLRHHNHSPAFWKFVETEAPTHEASKEWLRTRAHEGDFLLKQSALHLGPLAPRLDSM